MKEKIEVANPYNEEHIIRLKEYEDKNQLSNTTSNYLLKTKNMLSEADYRQLEQTTPEIERTLFLSQNGNIITVAHLLGEKDRKICRMTIDNTASTKFQEKLLMEAENYAFTSLGMEDVVLLQEEGNHIPSSYLKEQGFDDLGIESGMQVYTKSKELEKVTTYQM